MSSLEMFGTHLPIDPTLQGLRKEGTARLGLCAIASLSSNTDSATHSHQKSTPSVECHRDLTRSVLLCALRMAKKKDSQQRLHFSSAPHLSTPRHSKHKRTMNKTELVGAHFCHNQHRSQSEHIWGFTSHYPQPSRHLPPRPPPLFFFFFFFFSGGVLPLLPWCSCRFPPRQGISWQFTRIQG